MFNIYCNCFAMVLYCFVDYHFPSIISPRHQTWEPKLAQKVPLLNLNPMVEPWSSQTHWATCGNLPYKIQRKQRQQSNHHHLSQTVSPLLAPQPRMKRPYKFLLRDAVVTILISTLLLDQVPQNLGRTKQRCNTNSIHRINAVTSLHLRTSTKQAGSPNWLPQMIH